MLYKTTFPFNITYDSLKVKIICVAYRFSRMLFLCIDRQTSDIFQGINNSKFCHLAGSTFIITTQKKVETNMLLFRNCTKEI